MDTYIHTEWNITQKKNKNLPFATMWIDREYYAQ